ncbi:hypothetical protein CKM354_001158500 [Cercospora kikuchii]|uniref:NmrA-like domain-containing protein n=1 Tax=Cercospora kikuchii TaxID=84275 RepID=A0A9P3CTX4_9PEZI|nr:uncharacterized protein CKM354_001158500 [Cercospora kikuchii]GIZ48531.1 hypothetical protein CKM354_001158500 [Cercospora kikuchii]
MGSTANDNIDSIHKVLVLGDNRLSTSILSGISQASSTHYELHLAAHQKSSPSTNSHFSTHTTDFSNESLKAIFDELKPDVVFSTSHGGSFDTQKSIIDATISAGVPRFVTAEFGQDSQNTALHDRLPPLKGRWQCMQYLKELSDKGKIEWVAPATGTQLEQAITSGNIGFDMKWQSVTVHGTGEEQFAASSTKWNGRVAAAILENWNSVKNQYLYVPGMITSVNTCLAALQNVTGQEWERGNNEVEDLVREAERRIERGFPDAGMFLLEKSVLCDEGLNAVGPFRENDGKKVLGLEGESVEDVVAKVVHEFQHHGKADCGCG